DSLIAITSNGSAWGDVDEDGDFDLFVTSLFTDRWHLYINYGPGRFREEAIEREAGVNAGSVHSGWSVSFGDYDSDGWLDFYTTEWGNPNVDPAGVSSNVRLMQNVGAGRPGRFRDVTLAANASIDDGQPVTNTGAPFFGMYTFTPRFADMDRDGHTDIVIAGDFRTSRLLWNNGDGTFVDGTLAAQVGTDDNGMGCAIGDYDGDGLLDFFITSIFDPVDTCSTFGCNWADTGNRLYRNEGGRVFSDQTDFAGVRDGGWGWGATFFDYDNDGDLDLLQTNGMILPGTPHEDFFNTDPTKLWRNDGAGTFTEVGTAMGITDTASGKGVLTFDYDNDGDLDIVITNNGGPPVVYRNDTVNDNDWLRVDLRGDQSNSMGVGAFITVTPVRGGPSMVHEVTASSNFLGQDEITAHFGLGEGDAPVHEVVIDWPSGVTQTLRGVERNAELVVDEL
ncbi:MAG: CRTAC1 family protein, partial [Actinomycetota bacterium]